MNNRYFTLLALAAVFSVAAPATAQKAGRLPKKVKLATSPKLVKPIAVAGMSGPMNQVTPWYPIVEDNDWPGGPWFTIFDCAEISPVTGTAPNGAPYENPAYGPAYLVPPNFGLTSPLPGARFYSGNPTYTDPYAVNDMTINPLYAGFDAQRVAIGWYWKPVNATETMIVGISTAETFSSDPAGVPPPPMGPTYNLPYAGFLDGVTLNFGNNNGAGYAPGFYFANIDVSSGPTPLKWKMPVDGTGAYLMTILQSTAPATLASRAEPMLWITKQTNYGQPGGNPSQQGIWQWDDDNEVGTAGNVADGRHMTDPPGPAADLELYDYTQGPTFPIQEPFGAMMAFYSNYGAYTVVNNSHITTVLGTYAGGNLTSLIKQGDNNVYSVVNDEFDPNAQVNILVDTPLAGTTSMSIIFATGAARNDLSEFFDIFNYGGNSYNQANFRTNPGPISSVRVDLTNPGSNMNVDGEVRVRFRWIPQNDIDAADGWNQVIDRLTVFAK